MAILKEAIINGVTKVLGKLMIGNSPVYGDGKLVLNRSNYTNYYDATNHKLINIPKNTRLIACNGLADNTIIYINGGIEIAGIDNMYEGECDSMRISIVNHDSNGSGISLMGMTKSDWGGSIYAPSDYAQGAYGVIKVNRYIEFIYWFYAWYPTATY